MTTPLLSVQDLSVAFRQGGRQILAVDRVSFDLKQGEGGLVDLEFLLQYLVLRDAAHVVPYGADAALAFGTRTHSHAPAASNGRSRVRTQCSPRFAATANSRVVSASRSGSRRTAAANAAAISSSVQVMISSLSTSPPSSMSRIA